MRSLSEAARKQLASYKEAESDQTKGLFFLSEADLKEVLKKIETLNKKMKIELNR